MVNWLDRARSEIPKWAGQATAITDKRGPSAVLAGSHLGASGISRPSNGSNGSSLEASFWEIEYDGMSHEAVSHSPAILNAVQWAKSEVHNSLGLETAVSDERNLESGEKPPLAERVSNVDDCLPYPKRRVLYAKQNALYLRLIQRLDRYDQYPTDTETLAAQEGWAGNDAIAELYSGRRSWAVQRKYIYTWARAEIEAIRSHRRCNTGSERNAECGRGLDVR